MRGKIRILTSESAEKFRQATELNTEFKDSDKAYEISEVFFAKHELNEFYRFEDYIITYINGTKYDFLYEEELYNKMCAIKD